ncbi:nuclear factor NF4 [Toxoplasma gondii VAND]|uniref:Nuclear factor NF4 n=1 Tax=Toxoplasma gondii VAND TaxID=933077 RepID=A0A086PJH1_TOXGO|nr:nuclear factor NF4 [Toxoplasma gondii VAND]
MASTKSGALPLFWSAAELAANPRQFAAFQWVTGFAESLTVGSPRKPEENANTEEKQEDGTGGATSPAVSNLKFKGWEKGPRNSAANARRVAKAFSAVIPESAKLHLFTMGRETEEPEFDSAAMRLEIPGFGLVSGGVDLVIAKGGASLRRPPPHNGFTMMDDAQAVIECDFDISAVSRKQLRLLYVKTVLVHLLREKPVPVYLTDLQTGAIRASVLSGPRGVPMVIYERLTSEGFIHELQHGHRKPAMTAKTVSAIRRFKYGWCTAESRTRPPFAVDGRTGKHAEVSETSGGNAALQMPAASVAVSVGAPGAPAVALPSNSGLSGEGEGKEAFVTPKKRGRKPRDPSVSPAVTDAAPGEAEGVAAAKAKTGSAAPKQRAGPKKAKIDGGATHTTATSANGKSTENAGAPAPSSPAVVPAPKAKVSATTRAAHTDAKTVESDSDSSDSSSDESEEEAKPAAKAGAKTAGADAAGASAKSSPAQDSGSSDSEDSSSDED